MEGVIDARYVPTGHLVYAQDETLLAAPFDLARLEVSGGAVPVVEDVARAGGGGLVPQMSVSDSGSLVYVPSGGRTMLAWVDRAGDITPLRETPGLYRRPRFSPDGKRVALQNEDDIWIHDIGRDTMARLTTEGENAWPVWSPDGQWVAFASDRGRGRGSLSKAGGLQWSGGGPAHEGIRSTPVELVAGRQVARLRRPGTCRQGRHMGSPIRGRP